MHIGMTWEQFWYGNVWLVKVFNEKYRLDTEAENRREWMQGLYFGEALNAGLHNYMRGLTINKHAQTKQYLEKPIRITPLSEDEKAVEAERERKKAIDYFTNLQKKWERQQAGEPEQILIPMRK
jgi:hypothetical protein